DENLKFGGLAGAIRKCRTDFGAEIDIDLHRLEKIGGLSGAHCVLGTIGYPTPEPPGVLLYIKAALTGDEPSDVLEYKSRQSTFPHQSTADQWFDESQFESYRRLGLHVADCAFGSAGTPEEFFEELRAAIKLKDVTG